MYYIPSLPYPSGGPYQVAIVDAQPESDEKFEVTLTRFWGLKQKEGVPRNIERKHTKMNI